MTKTCLMCKYGEDEASDETTYHPVDGGDDYLCSGCRTLLENWKTEYKNVLVLVDDSLPEETREEIGERAEELYGETEYEGVNNAL